MNGRAARRDPKWIAAKKTYDGEVSLGQKLAALAVMTRIEAEYAKGVTA